MYLTQNGKGRFFFILSVIVFLCWGSSPSLLAEGGKKETLSIEELAKTKASQLFVTRRFQEALEEFKNLSRQYPKDIVIRRYIGACLDYLRRDDEAIAAFQKVLDLNNADLPSRQFIGKIYLRKGNLDKAAEQFDFILTNDKRGTFIPFAQAQLATIQRLKEAEKQVTKTAGRQLAAQDFLKTSAAQLFVNAKYREAAPEFEKLEKAYPNDTTVKRYKGLTLDKLGRLDEAIMAFQSGLAIVPNNIPLHYFLAQSYIHKQDLKGARSEFEYVIENDESGAYKVRAQQELQAVLQLIELLKPPRKWSVNASAAAEWNSNPTSTTHVPTIKTTGHTPSSWKFTTTAGGNYTLFKKSAWSGKTTYSYSENYYSSSLNQLNTMSHTWGLNLTYTKTVRGKPLTLQFGESIPYTFVHDKYYSLAFTESVTALYSFKDWQRLTLSEKWTVISYPHEGTDPDITARSGFGNVASITNDFYLNQAKTCSINFNFEYGQDDTQGTNYKKQMFTGRSAFHFPLLSKFEGDLSFKLKDSQFPKSGFPTNVPTRRDEEFVLTGTLSRPLTKHWSVNGSYSYTNVQSLDDNFTYINHVLGFTLSYNY